VNVNSNGMVQHSAVTVPGMEDPLLILTDEEENEGVDFE
jgi:hypothetical protein